MAKLHTFRRETAATLAQMARERMAVPQPGMVAEVPLLADDGNYQIVAVDGDDGHFVEPEGEGLFSGTVQIRNPDEPMDSSATFGDGVPIWIGVINRISGSISPHCRLPAGERFLAVREGPIEFGSDERTLYLIHHARTQRRLLAKLNGAADAEAGTVAIKDVQTLAGGNAGVAPTEAANPMKWPGNDDDWCYLTEDFTAGSEPAYYLDFVMWDLITIVRQVFDDYPDSMDLKRIVQQLALKANQSPVTQSWHTTDDQCPSS